MKILSKQPPKMNQGKQPQKQIEIRDAISQGQLRIDKERCIIFDVKVMGEASKNGYAYTPQLRRSLHQTIENMPWNYNHRPKDKPAQDVPFEARGGVFKNVRESSDSTLADLHYLGTHPNAARLVEMAEKMPWCVGASIFGLGHGKSKDKNGRIILDSMLLKSVDIVADPAGVKSLFDSIGEQPMDEEEEVGAEAHYAQACEKACLEIISKAIEGSITPEDAAKQVKEHIKHHHKMYGKEEGPEEEEGDGEEMEEQDRTWMKEYKKLKTESDCRLICDSLNYSPDKDDMTVLVALDDEEARKAYVGRQKRKAVANKKNPRIPVEVRDSKEDIAPSSQSGAKVDYKQMAESLRS